MNIELAVVIVVFGPIILIRFLRSPANHARRAWAKAPPPQLQPKQGLKRKLAPREWASPERIGGERWATGRAGDSEIVTLRIVWHIFLLDVWHRRSFVSPVLTDAGVQGGTNWLVISAQQ